MTTTTDSLLPEDHQPPRYARRGLLRIHDGPCCPGCLYCPPATSSLCCCQSTGIATRGPHPPKP